MFTVNPLTKIADRRGPGQHLGERAIVVSQTNSFYFTWADIEKAARFNHEIGCIGSVWPLYWPTGGSCDWPS